MTKVWCKGCEAWLEQHEADACFHPSLNQPVYVGTLSKGGNTASVHTVTVDRQDGHGPRLLRHYVLHSPTGFSWGYLGSGPAELARCILWEALGTEPTRPLYQAFKERFVARWPQDAGWSVTHSEIYDWLAEWAGDRDDAYLTVNAQEANWAEAESTA